MDRPKVVVADAVIRAWIEAGILPAGQRTRRVVVDLQAGEPPVIYVQYWGDERLLDVAQTLAGVEITSTPAPERTDATRKGKASDAGPPPGAGADVTTGAGAVGKVGADPVVAT